MLKIFWILLNSFSSIGTFGFQKSDFSQYLRCCFRFRKVTVLRVLTLLKSKGNICTLMFTTKVLKNSTFESQSKGKSFYFYIKKDERESQSKATRGETQVEIIRIINRLPAEWNLDLTKSLFIDSKVSAKIPVVDTLLSSVTFIEYQGRTFIKCLYKIINHVFFIEKWNW